MTTRSCACPHRFPVCACNEGWHGEALLRRSRRLSLIAGWQEPDATAPADQAAQARRAAKPRVPLGVKLGSPACGPCNAGKT